MLNKKAKAYSEISKCFKHLQDGVLVSIDPSAGSRSSQPGYAVYSSGELIEAGILQISPDFDLPTRLRLLSSKIHILYDTYKPDVLVTEDIPAQRHGGNAQHHMTLLKAVGAVLSVPGVEYTVSLHPVSWKNMVRDTYVKSDKNDAIEMGWIAIQEAARIQKVLEQARTGGTRSDEE